jgi:bacterioferritin
MDGGPTHPSSICIELQTALIRGSARVEGPGVDYAAFLFVFVVPDRSLIMSDVFSPPENEQVIATLNRILELELAGLVRYLHYSFMIFGHNRIPIVGWLRDQAEESKTHATQAGEHITNLGGHPSLKLGSLLETHKHNVDEILAEALAHEEEGLDEYRKLLKQVEGKSIMLEEYSRAQISAEEEHLAEIRKMMRRPGSIK